MTQIVFVVGIVLTAIGAVKLWITASFEPPDDLRPTQGEVDALKEAAFRAEESTERALQLMYVADVEEELRAYQEGPEPTGSILIIGLFLVAESVLSWAIR